MLAMNAVHLHYNIFYLYRKMKFTLLQALLSGRESRLSDSLTQVIEEHCSRDLVDRIEEKISDMAVQLQEALVSAAQSRRLRPDGSEPEDVAQTRTRAALSLMFLALESIILDEVSLDIDSLEITI